MNSRTGLLFQVAAIAGRRGCRLGCWSGCSRRRWQGPHPAISLRRRVSGDSAHFAGVFAADPRTDELPLIWRTSPRLGLAPWRVTV